MSIQIGGRKSAICSDVNIFSAAIHAQRVISSSGFFSVIIGQHQIHTYYAVLFTIKKQIMDA